MYVCMYVCMYIHICNSVRIVLFCTYVAAPPAITAIEANEICTNDFTVSWTPASNEEGLSYVVTLFQPGTMNGILDFTVGTSYNFTGLTPNTAYNISIASALNSCSGTRNTIMFTTVTVEAGVPQSELTVMNCISCYIWIIFKSVILILRTCIFSYLCSS